MNAHLNRSLLIFVGLHVGKYERVTAVSHVGSCNRANQTTPLY